MGDVRFRASRDQAAIVLCSAGSEEMYRMVLGVRRMCRREEQVCSGGSRVPDARFI